MWHRRSFGGFGIVAALLVLLPALAGAQNGAFIQYYPPSGAYGPTYVGNNSFFIGSGGPTSTGQGNTLMGDAAGANIASGGVENTIVGWLAGDAITTGDYNTALGSGALSTVQTGAGNIGIGGNALQNYTGDYATAIGFESFKVATGNYNTGLGRNTGLQVTTGQHNVALGLSALSVCTGCSYNMAIGSSTLNGATGDENVAVGYLAGSNNVANQNVFIGASSGGTCSAAGATENVLIGRGSNCSAAASERIIAIGSGAAAANYGIAIGRNVTALANEVTIQAVSGTRFSTESFQASKSKALTDGAAAVSFTRIAVANNSYMGGELLWTATSTDATDYRATVGRTRFAFVNKAGAENCGTPAAVGTDLTTSSNANTLVCTWTATSAAADTCDLQVTCTDNTAAAQTISMKGHLQLTILGTVTPQ